MKCERLTLFVLLVLMGTAVAVIAANDAAEDNRSPRRAERSRAGGVEMVDVIVVYKTKPDQAEADRVRGLGGKVYREFGRLPMRAMRIPKHALEKLGNGKGVKFIAQDKAVASFAKPEHAVANHPASNSNNGVFGGLSVTVAVVDSGIDAHGDLPFDVKQYDLIGGAFPTPTIVNGEIDIFNDTPRTDGWGHGTHIAGTVAGSGNASNGAVFGFAGQADLVSLRVLDDLGRGVTSDVIAAMDWLLQYGQYFDIGVVNLSLGKSVDTYAAQDPLVAAVEAVWDAGIVVIVASGNYGNDGHFTVASPGISRKVITVGSLSFNNGEYVSTFSSRGPTMYDHFLKPDLVAPGNRVVAAIPGNAGLRAMLPDRVIPCSASASCNDDYLELSGTSMAAAVASAAAARMLDKDPSATPDDIKARMMRSARKFPDDPTNVGAGVLDINAAMDDTGTCSAALSPIMELADNNNVVLVEDTALLWGDTMWGVNDVWSDSYVWGDGYIWADGYVWADAVANHDPLLDTSGQSAALNDD